MANLSIPGSLCVALHPAYTGPDSLKPVLDHIVGAARKMIAEAIEAGIQPAAIPPAGDPGIHRNVSFPADIQKVINRYALDEGIPQSLAARAFLLAAMARGLALGHRYSAAADENDALRPYRQAINPDHQRREEQSLLYSHLITTLSGGKIGFIEGATGIGKTLAMTAAAIDSIRDGGRAVISAPTLQVLRDFIGTHARIRDALPETPPARVVLGMGEYVSANILREILAEKPGDDNERILAWLDAGGPPQGKDVAIGRHYLVSSLHQIAPDFPAEGVKLGTDTDLDDPGRMSYARQFQKIFPLEAFVSAKRLAAAMEAHPDSAAIPEWLASGAPAADVDGSLGGRDYLADSLRRIAPGFPVHAVTLTDADDDDDPGRLAFQNQMIFAMDDGVADTIHNEVIFCTHAMMAVDLRSALRAAQQSEAGAEAVATAAEAIQQLSIQRKSALAANDKDLAKDLGQSMARLANERDATLAALSSSLELGRLPPWQHLIIDEAHLFESNVANILATNLSLIKLRHDIEKMAQAGFFAQSRATEFSSLLKQVRDMADVSRDGDIDLNTLGDSTTYRSRTILADLADTICRGKKRKDEPRLMHSIRTRASHIKEALKIGTSDRGASNKALLQFSPVREFPALHFGRKSIARELGFLWERANSVAFVSATLFLRKAVGYSAKYMSSVLNANTPRTTFHDPIHPVWAVAPAQGLWTPTARRRGDDSYWLQPPGRSDGLTGKLLEVATTRWIEEVTETIRRIHQGDRALPPAAGGTLVLTTSYQTAKSLAAGLAPHHDAILASNPDEPLIRQRERFMTMSAEGRRPIWLAVGGAWTGLDINGASLGLQSGQDNILTDLIIPRIPFGLNRSLTHLHRTESISDIPWDMLDSMMRFRQGLGRLVRREGLTKNRRIFILDGRLSNPKFASFLSTIRQIMNIYPQMTLEEGKPR